MTKPKKPRIARCPCCQGPGRLRKERGIRWVECRGPARQRHAWLWMPTLPTRVVRTAIAAWNAFAARVKPARKP